MELRVTTEEADSNQVVIGGHVSPSSIAAGEEWRAADRRPSALSGKVDFLRNYATVILMIILIIVFSLTSSNFLTLGNIQNVLLVQTVIACVAFGVMFPLIVGEFDLSVGYMIGFIGMVGAYLGEHGFQAPSIIPIMLATGIVVGLANGLLTERMHISSFIATLGVGIVLQGLTQGLSGGTVLTTVPPFIQTLGRGYAGGLAIAVWITLGIAIALFYLLEDTPLGRSWYAIGGSERVAFLAGLRTMRLKIATFTLSGLFVACGAIFALGQNGSAMPGFGPDLLLPAYAAAFLGVTTYRGGKYNIVGTIVAILLLGLGFNGLSLWGVPFWIQPVFNGGVLILAVVGARVESRHALR